MSKRLDDEFLEELREIMEDEFPLLLDTYLKESRAQAAVMSEALSGSDLDVLRRAAHSLKGGSGNIGAAELSTLCAQLEAEARDQVEEALPATLDAVLRELDAVQAEIRDLRAGQ